MSDVVLAEILGPGDLTRDDWKYWRGQAEVALAQATDNGMRFKVRDRARALRAAAKEMGVREAEVEASIIVADAERRVVGETPRVGGGRRKNCDTSVTIVDAARKELSRLRKAHEHLPDDDYEQVVQAARVEGKPVTRKRLTEAQKTDTEPRPNHPAKYSAGMMRLAAQLLPDGGRILDPMAGVGRIHRLQQHGFETVGVELEAEWAAEHPDTIRGDARALHFPDGRFDGIVTSPPYGNRMADGLLLDGTTRRTYSNALGRDLAEGNAGGLQWGDAYRKLMAEVWAEAVRALCPGGRFVLFHRDHIRDGQWIPVTGWHIATLMSLGLTLWTVAGVPTPGFGYGQNAQVRAGGEVMVVFDRP